MRVHRRRPHRRLQRRRQSQRPRLRLLISSSSSKGCGPMKGLNGHRPSASGQRPTSGNEHSPWAIRGGPSTDSTRPSLTIDGWPTARWPLRAFVPSCLRAFVPPCLLSSLSSSSPSPSSPSSSPSSSPHCPALVQHYPHHPLHHQPAQPRHRLDPLRRRPRRPRHAPRLLVEPRTSATPRPSTGGGASRTITSISEASATSPPYLDAAPRRAIGLRMPEPSHGAPTLLKER